MKAIIIDKFAQAEEKPLRITELPVPQPYGNQILVKIKCCGICHTDLDEIEGRLIPPKLPIVPGHQIVGVVEKKVSGTFFNAGDRVGITWLNSSCGKCEFCKSNRENLCYNAKWTGLDVNGGYAEYILINEQFAYPIPDIFSDAQASPLLCAGVIGYRAQHLLEPESKSRIGLFGFGASAHIVIQILKFQYPNIKIFAFSRNKHHQEYARKLGADWAGSVDDSFTEKLDGAIDFTPSGKIIPQIMEKLERGGKLIINAIRKIEPIDCLDYAKHLWHEKIIQSTANVTRDDALDFLSLASRILIKPQVEEFDFEKANEAVLLLKQSKLKAAACLRIS
ncbi:MAG: zinc-dependent alcohol dehydrogenase family protein [Phycisphaerales bacterium]